MIQRYKLMCLHKLDKRCALLLEFIYYSAFHIYTVCSLQRVDRALAAKDLSSIYRADFVVRSPGLRFRWIVLVLSVGDARR